MHNAATVHYVDACRGAEEGPAVRREGGGGIRTSYPDKTLNAGNGE